MSRRTGIADARGSANPAGAGAPAAELEESGGRVDAAVPDRAPHRHRSADGRRLEVAADVQVGIDRRAHAFRIPELHAFAAGADVQLARQIAVEPDPAAKLHAAAAQRRREIVELQAARVEPDRRR